MGDGSVRRHGSADSGRAADEMGDGSVRRRGSADSDDSTGEMRRDGARRRGSADADGSVGEMLENGAGRRGSTDANRSPGRMRGSNARRGEDKEAKRAPEASREEMRRRDAQAGMYGSPEPRRGHERRRRLALGGGRSPELRREERGNDRGRGHAQRSPARQRQEEGEARVKGSECLSQYIAGADARARRREKTKRSDEELCEAKEHEYSEEEEYGYNLERRRRRKQERREKVNHSSEQQRERAEEQQEVREDEFSPDPRWQRGGGRNGGSRSPEVRQHHDGRQGGGSRSPDRHGQHDRRQTGGSGSPDPWRHYAGRARGETRSPGLQRKQGGRWEEEWHLQDSRRGYGGRRDERSPSPERHWQRGTHREGWARAHYSPERQSGRAGARMSAEDMRREVGQDQRGREGGGGGLAYSTERARDDLQEHRQKGGEKGQQAEETTPRDVVPRHSRDGRAYTPEVAEAEGRCEKVRAQACVPAAAEAEGENEKVGAQACTSAVAKVEEKDGKVGAQVCTSAVAKAEERDEQVGVEAGVSAATGAEERDEQVGAEAGVSAATGAEERDEQVGVEAGVSGATGAEECDEQRVGDGNGADGGFSVGGDNRVGEIDEQTRVSTDPEKQLPSTQAGWQAGSECISISALAKLVVGGVSRLVVRQRAPRVDAQRRLEMSDVARQLQEDLGTVARTSAAANASAPSGTAATARTTACAPSASDGKLERSYLLHSGSGLGVGVGGCGRAAGAAGAAGQQKRVRFLDGQGGSGLGESTPEADSGGTWPGGGGERSLPLSFLHARLIQHTSQCSRRSSQEGKELGFALGEDIRPGPAVQMPQPTDPSSSHPHHAPLTSHPHCHTATSSHTLPSLSSPPQPTLLLHQQVNSLLRLLHDLAFTLTCPPPLAPLPPLPFQTAHRASHQGPAVSLVSIPNPTRMHLQQTPFRGPGPQACPESGWAMGMSMGMGMGMGMGRDGWGDKGLEGMEEYGREGFVDELMEESPSVSERREAVQLSHHLLVLAYHELAHLDSLI
ncbi:unnamed protein product [Closterium sp. NIES-64]|nr:unnamed protein product [Closterium sp. NIES-64]